MEYNSKIFLVLALLAGSVAADGWVSPIYADVDNCLSGCTTQIIDNNLATYRINIGFEAPAYKIGFDMGSSINVSAVRFYVDNVASVSRPCKSTVIKVCDSGLTCSSSSNILTNVCYFTNGWTTCNIPVTTGRYVYVEGGAYNTGTSTCDTNYAMAYLYDVQMYSVQPVSSMSSTGPCLTFCDYVYNNYVPQPGAANLGTEQTWNITWTSTSYENLEGEPYLENDWSNVFITGTNGSSTGTCTGYQPGNITSIKRFTGTNPNRLQIAYYYGNLTGGSCILNPPQINICFNGTRNTGYSYTTTASDAGTFSDTFDIISDTTKNYHYNLTYLNEEYGTNYNLTYFPVKTTFYCKGAFEDVPITLTTGENSVIYQLRSSANIVTDYDDGKFMRTFDTEDSKLLYIYAPVPENITGTQIFTLVLNDFTGGQWGQSSLLSEIVVNNSKVAINNDTWPTGQSPSQYLWLKNGTRVKFTAKSRLGPSYSFDWIILTAAETTKTLTIGTPILFQGFGNCVGIVSSISVDYVNSAFSLAISSNDPGVVTYMNVSNASWTPYVPTYSASGLGATTLMYTSPDRNMPLFVQWNILSSSGDSCHYSQLINLYNVTNPLPGSSFNQALPDNILGAPPVTWKRLAALIVSLFILFLFAKATDAGVGAIAGSLSFIVFMWIQWIPSTTQLLMPAGTILVPWWVGVSLVAASFAYKLVERRVL